MKITRALAIVFAFSLLVLSGMPAYAGLVYSTFGPGNAYDMDTGYTVGLNGSQQVAAAFQPLSDFTLYSINFAASCDGINDPSGLITVRLTDVNANNIFETFTISVDGYPSDIYTATSVVHPSLSADQVYWIVLSAQDSGDTFAWNWNNQGYTGWYRNMGTGWEDLNYPNVWAPAFAVNSAPVPIPGALVLYGSGLLGLIGIDRKRFKK